MKKIENGFELAQFAQKKGIVVTGEQAHYIMEYGLGVFESLYEMNGELFIASPTHTDIRNLLTKAKNNSYYSLIGADLVKDEERYAQVASDRQILNNIDLDRKD